MPTAQNGSPRAGSPRAGVPRTEPPRTEPPRTESPRTGSPRTGSPRTGSPRTDRPHHRPPDPRPIPSPDRRGPRASATWPGSPASRWPRPASRSTASPAWPTTPAAASWASRSNSATAPTRRPRRCAGAGPPPTASSCATSPTRSSSRCSPAPRRSRAKRRHPARPGLPLLAGTGAPAPGGDGRAAAGRAGHRPGRDRRVDQALARPAARSPGGGAERLGGPHHRGVPGPPGQCRRGRVAAAPSPNSGIPRWRS